MESLNAGLQSMCMSAVLYGMFTWMYETNKMTRFRPKDSTILCASYYVLFLIISNVYNEKNPLNAIRLIAHVVTANAIASYLRVGGEITVASASSLGVLVAWNPVFMQQMLLIDAYMSVLRSGGAPTFPVNIAHYGFMILNGISVVHQDKLDVVSVIVIFGMNLIFYDTYDVPMITRNTREQTYFLECERKAEEERLERERKAEEERLERERKAEEERLERERKEEERLERERKAEEERLERERKAEEERSQLVIRILKQEERERAREAEFVLRIKEQEEVLSRLMIQNMMNGHADVVQPKAQLIDLDEAPQNRLRLQADAAEPEDARNLEDIFMPALQ